MLRYILKQTMVMIPSGMPGHTVYVTCDGEAQLAELMARNAAVMAYEIMGVEQLTPQPPQRFPAAQPGKLPPNHFVYTGAKADPVDIEVTLHDNNRLEVCVVGAAGSPTVGRGESVLEALGDLFWQTGQVRLPTAEPEHLAKFKLEYGSARSWRRPDTRD